MKSVIIFYLLCCCSLIGLSQNNINEGLIGYYPFNGNSNDYQCKLNNGGGGSCIKGNFSGSDTFVNDSLGNTSSAISLTNNVKRLQDSNGAYKYYFTNAFSISFFFKIDEFTSPYLLEHTPILFTSNSSIYNIKILQNQIQFNHFPNNSLVANVNIKPQRWYHITVTHNGTDITLYLDGQNIAQGTGTIFSGYSFNHNMFIGGGSDIYNTQFSYSGQLDELRIYDKAISQNVIQELLKLNQITPDIDFVRICMNGQAIDKTLNFVSLGKYIQGNIFSAQLSDVNGSFANPLTIGTLTSNTSGNLSINCQIPANLPRSNNYRFRIVSSQPTSSQGINGTTTILTSIVGATINGPSSIVNGENAALVITTTYGLPYSVSLYANNGNNDYGTYLGQYSITTSPQTINVTPTKTTRYTFETYNFCGPATGSTTVSVVCNDNKNLFGVAGSGIEQVNNSIVSTQVINSNISLSYKAGKSIALNPGFNANSGSIFNAQIAGCN